MERKGNVDDQTLEALAELICGDDKETAPLYRSSSNLTRFFESTKLPRFVHEGSTRKWWTLEALRDCTRNELEGVISRLASPREYRGDAPSTRKAITSLNRILQLEGLRVDLKNGQPIIVSIPVDFDLGEDAEEKELEPLPPPEPDKNGRDATAEVASPHRSEAGRESPDPEKGVDWQAVSGVVGIIGLVVITIGTIVPVWLHYGNSGQTVEGVAEGVAKGVAEGLKKFAEINAEAVSKNPGESGELAERVRGDPAAPRIDREIAAAVLRQQEGKIEEAIEKWRSIANIAGEENRELQARAWFSIGYLLSKGEGADLEAEMDAYTKAIKLNPNLVAAYNNLGTVKNGLGQYDAAIPYYTRAIELNRDNAFAYNNLGNAKNGRGQYDAAIPYYTRAIELDPTYVDPHLNLGNAKKGLRQYDAALADYDRAIELNPTLAEAYNNRGAVKRSLGRISEARADYQQALVLAQEASKANLVAAVRRNLSRLGNNAAP